VPTERKERRREKPVLLAEGQRQREFFQLRTRKVGRIRVRLTRGNRGGKERVRFLTFSEGRKKMGPNPCRRGTSPERRSDCPFISWGEIKEGRGGREGLD